MNSKLMAYLRSDARFTKRTFPAVLRAGFTLEDVLSEIRSAPESFVLEIGCQGDVYLSAR
jgi:hypothetical protein